MDRGLLHFFRLLACRISQKQVQGNTASVEDGQAKNKRLPRSIQEKHFDDAKKMSRGIDVIQVMKKCT